MRPIPSRTSSTSGLLLGISALALAGQLLSGAIVARPTMPTMAWQGGRLPVPAVTAVSRHPTISEEPRPAARRLRTDARWYLLATAATARNRYPAPFAAAANAPRAAAHARRTRGPSPGR